MARDTKKRRSLRSARYGKGFPIKKIVKPSIPGGEVHESKTIKLKKNGQLKN